MCHMYYTFSMTTNMNYFSINDYTSSPWFGRSFKDTSADITDLVYEDTAKNTWTQQYNNQYSNYINWSGIIAISPQPYTTTAATSGYATSGYTQIVNLLLPYKLNYVDFKAAYKKLEGYVFIMTDLHEKVTSYLSKETVLELIYKFYGDHKRLPFPVQDQDLELFFRLPSTDEEEAHALYIPEEDLKTFYQVFSEP